MDQPRFDAQSFRNSKEGVDYKWLKATGTAGLNPRNIVVKLHKLFGLVINGSEKQIATFLKSVVLTLWRSAMPVGN